MLETTKLPETKQFATASEVKVKNHFKVIEKTYQSNTESDYTEKIEQLDKNFNYSSNSNHYWGPAELSTLYGTPVYAEASPTQKLALNHLYWVGQYNHTAASEANTMLYNQVTSGVFSNISGYETLCEELDFETSQERYHLHAFQKIGYRTKIALMGKESLGNPLQKKSDKSSNKGWVQLLAPKPLQQMFSAENVSSSLSAWQEQGFRFINNTMLKSKADSYSQFLKEKGSKTIPTATGGLAGITAPPSIFKFLTLSWGSSPFLASQYYSARMIANMSLKAYEYSYYKHFKELDAQGEFIPTPTAVSHYHLLDESFHTTMSQIIAQDVYKDFSKPTAYEKFLANAIVYLAQRGILGGLSGGIPATFRNDAAFMLPIFRLLQSPVFNMSTQDALHWMEKCLCQEHEGFHTNLKSHQRLLSDFRRFFGKLDYLLPFNREMQVMAAGGSISKAIQSNISAFEQFSRTVAQSH